MSEYNRRNSKMPESVPGTSVQQMWHVLNFHEQRFSQMSKYLQVIEKKIEALEAQTPLPVKGVTMNTDE